MSDTTNDDYDPLRLCREVEDEVSYHLGHRGLFEADHTEAELEYRVFWPNAQGGETTGWFASLDDALARVIAKAKPYRIERRLTITCTEILR